MTGGASGEAGGCAEARAGLGCGGGQARQKEGPHAAAPRQWEHFITAHMHYWN